jgi:hypothetical protein
LFDFHPFCFFILILLFCSVEVQAQLLASISNTADLKGIALVQRWFRRWQAKRALLIRAKVRASRLTMDADMAEKLKGGKRRTMDVNASGGSLLLAGAANKVQSQRLIAQTTPSTPTTQLSRPTSGRQTPVHQIHQSTSSTATTATTTPVSSSITTAAIVAAAPSNSFLTPPPPSTSTSNPTSSDFDEIKAAKKRASMQRMLLIQSRFREDGSIEVTGASEAPETNNSNANAAAAVASTVAAAAKAASSSSASSDAGVPSSSSSTNETEDRRGVRLNNRRRTFTSDVAAAANATITATATTGNTSTTNTAISPPPAAATATATSPITKSAPIPSSSSSITRVVSPLHVRKPTRITAASAAASFESEKVTEKNLRFIFLVVRLQRKFQARRAALRARLAEKVALLQKRQTLDADRKLRRASMPMGELGAIRSRLSAQMNNTEEIIGAPAQNIVAPPR